MLKCTACQITWSLTISHHSQCSVWTFFWPSALCTNRPPLKPCQQMNRILSAFRKGISYIYYSLFLTYLDPYLLRSQYEKNIPEWLGCFCADWDECVIDNSELRVWLLPKHGALLQSAEPSWMQSLFTAYNIPLKLLHHFIQPQKSSKQFSTLV